MARRDTVWPVAGMLTGLVILTTGVPPAEAHRGARPSLIEMRDDLGLGEDQVRAIREARRRQATARRSLVEELAAARRSLRDLVFAGADPVAVHAQTQEVQRLVGAAIELRVQTLQEIAHLLTPEQREKLRARGPGVRLRRLGGPGPYPLAG